MHTSSTPLTPLRCRPRRLAVGAFMALALGLAINTAEAAPGETDPIFRMQLLVRTCNRPNAQTDSAVTASLRPGNLTVLDYGRDDFPRDDTFTYDLILDGVSQFNDVTRLEVRNTGTDGVCIRTLELRANGRRLFRRNLGAAGRFLDSAGTPALLSTAGQLRANAFWENYDMPVFALGDTIVMTRGELESRVEATAGTAFSGTPVGWGGLNGPRFVEATRVDASTLHFDLDTQVDTMAALSMSPASAVSDAFDGLNGIVDDINGVITFFGFSPIAHFGLPNRNVDIDFNMAVSCGGGSLAFTVGSPSVDVQTIPNLAIPTVPNVPGLGGLVNSLNQAIGAVNGGLASLRNAIDAFAESRLGIDTLEAGFATSLSQLTIAFETPLCPQIAVQNNADLNLTLSL